MTCAELPDGTEGDRLLAGELKKLGANGEFVDWRSDAASFTGFDLLVLRSCWDYHLAPDQFTDWLRKAAREVPVLNDTKAVLWNMDKFYLKELAQRGIEIAPTEFLASGEQCDLRAIAGKRDWPQFIVKPAISASAHKTWLLRPHQIEQGVAAVSSLQGQAFLVQEFLPEVQTAGEISFVYIDGRYSHAVLKRAASGDFRVQKEFGGSAELYTPSNQLRDQLETVCSRVPEIGQSLYCRIDVVERKGRAVLMELELIEPELFLHLAPGAAKQMAKAIEKRL